MTAANSAHRTWSRNVLHRECGTIRVRLQAGELGSVRRRERDPAIFPICFGLPRSWFASLPCDRLNSHTTGEGRMELLRRDWLEILPLTAGTWIIVRSIRGIARRKLTTYGRGGRSQTFEGKDAVREGVFQIAFGLIFIAIAAYVLLMRVWS